MPTLRIVTLNEIIGNLNSLYHYWEMNKNKRDCDIVKSRDDDKDTLQRRKAEAANNRLQYNIIIMYLISFIIDTIAFVYEKEIFSSTGSGIRVSGHRDKMVAEMNRDTFNKYLFKIYGNTSGRVRRTINGLFNTRNSIAHNLSNGREFIVNLMVDIDLEVCLNVYVSLLSKLDLKSKFKLQLYEMLEHVFFGNFLDVSTNVGKLFLQQKELIEKDIQRQQEGKVVESNNKSSKSDIEKLLESVSSNSAKNEVEKYIIKSIDELK